MNFKRQDASHLITIIGYLNLAKYSVLPFYKNIVGLNSHPEPVMTSMIGFLISVMLNL